MTAFVRMSVDTSGADKVLAGLRKDQVPFAAALTVNELAKDIVRIEKVEIQTSFDRPTPFIVNTPRVAKFAKKGDPHAIIGLKDVFGRFGQAAENALRPQIEGGERKPKSTEKRLRQIGVIGPNEWLVGVDTATNVYGNIPGPEHVKMLSYFRAFREAGFNANRVGGASASRKGFRYFIRPIGSGRGIFRVRGRRGKPKLMWLITSNTPDYQKRFDFYGEAQRHAKQFAPYFAKKAMEKALLTAR